MTYTIPLIIDGQDKTSSKTFPVDSPLSHTTIWTCSSASSEDVDAAVAAASAAFPSWSKIKPTTRRNILLKAADLLEQRAEGLRLQAQQETGSADFYAVFELAGAVELIRDTAGRCSTIAGSIPTCDEEGTSGLVLKEPYGVVLAIAPWNAPYVLGVRSILFALAAGNTCVLKGSELSPRCFYNIGRAFVDAGLPAGALNVIYCCREDAPAITTRLINAPVVRKINFTGSTAVGAIIAATAGRALKPCLMELGGKAAAIVLDDADIELAAMQCTMGAFLHGGQICMSTERILVHTAVADQFRTALKRAVAGFASGPAPVLALGAGVARTRALVADALAKGATLLHGDHTAEEPHPDTGEPSATRLRPIVVDGVTSQMALYYEESFGPSVSLIEVKDEDEAVSIANDTEYGLAGAIFTRDLARGLRIARRLECGSVQINGMTAHSEPTLPHGGVKASGWGCFNSQWGLDEFLRIKTVTFKE
ncbi:Aldehyde/histidinol dehydrogenase [Mycena galopus ATCC 62051]|nr:Aldehyde/histidinol dehydrogenase [Mycena galopus ATCC 62051]